MARHGDLNGPFTTRDGTGVRCAAPLTKYLAGASNESCQSGLRKNMSGSISATVAVVGTGGSA
jgi:hypothetical protein